MVALNTGNRFSIPTPDKTSSSTNVSTGFATLHPLTGGFVENAVVILTQNLIEKPVWAN
jgi:hypothetical protein